MKTLIEKFSTRDAAGEVIPNVLDYAKLIAAPQEEFAAFYLQSMENFKEKGGFWSDGHIPVCSECSHRISGPSEMRRYYGRSLHPQCFSLARNKIDPEQKRRYEPNADVKRYLDRVERLDLSSI